MNDYDAVFENAAKTITGGAANEPSPYDEIFKAVQPQALAAQATPKSAPRGTGSAVIDTGNAIGTGYFRGLAGLAGLPVDTAANVLDLGKAAFGAPYTAVTGKPAPDWLQPGDRKDVFGSGAYLLDKAQQTSVGRTLTKAINPDFEGGYLQAAGAALNGVIRPQTALQGANQAVNSVAGVLGGKLVGDTTGNQSLAIAAGMLPTAAQSAATSSLKYAVRGGEAGRKAMEQRIQDLRAAGVENPTLGLASGNGLIGGLENLLQSTPGAIGTMRRSRDAAVLGMDEKAAQAAAAASPQRGALEAGTAIQAGIKSFRDGFKDTQAGLYGNLDRFIPGQTPTNVTGTKQALATMNADIPGAPQLSKQFKNSRIMAIEDAMHSDTAGNPPGVVMQAFGAGGLMNTPVLRQIGVVPAGSSTNTLPFEAVKKTRTLVGNEIADAGLMSTVPRSKWNSLYGALSGDMQAVAQQNGPQAVGSFNRATDYTRAGLARLDRVAPFAEKVAPEQAYTAMVQATKENVSTLQAVKKTLPQDARGTFAGTVIERLGRASNGVQNEAGTAWSPEAFLTNWNKMKPEARAEMFSGFPNSRQVVADVEAVAKAASMMRDNSKMWANPSGSGANLAARGLLGTVAGGAAAAAGGLLSPVVPALAVGGLLSARMGAGATTSPVVVNSMAQRSGIDPQMTQSQINALFSSGLLSQQKQD